MSNSSALEIFQSSQGADCVIEVVPQSDGQDKQEFNVQKYMLMINSDVFMAMFSHENTKEFLDSRIVIQDSTATAVRQMLIYLYTGELPKEYVIEKDAVPLMLIANKYLIKSLVQLIEQGLIDSLSLENVFDRLEMADLYQLKSLNSSCGQWIRRKLKTVRKEVKWLELKEKAPEMVFAILEEFPEENRNVFQSIEQELINSLSLENVFDRVEMADLYQLKSLHSSCGQLIRRNLKMVVKEAKWQELKEKAPKLVLSIFYAF